MGRDASNETNPAVHLAGVKNFKVREIEVFRITPKLEEPAVEEESKASDNKTTATGLNSKIVHDQMKKMFVMSLFPDKKFNLLYRGSENSFSADRFSQMCSFKGATLTIVLSDKYRIFGLFTDIPLGCFTASSVKGNGNTFKFSVSKQGIERFKVLPDCLELQLIDKSMIASENFVIWDRCDKNKENMAYIGEGFEGSDEIVDETHLAGAENFAVVEIEVYQVI